MPGEPWADRAHADLASAPPAWRPILQHARTLGDRTRPTKRWLADGQQLTDALERDTFASTLGVWLEVAAEPPPDPRRSVELMAQINGEILRGLVLMAGPTADSALAARLGGAARAFATKVRFMGQRSTRVANACIKALAAASVEHDHALGDLLNLQWTIDYPSTRAFITRTVEEVCRQRGVTEDVLRRLAAPAGAASAPGADAGTLAAAMEQAAARLGDGQPDQALNRLLAVWRACHDPRVAQMIETLSAHLARNQAAALRRPTQKATLQAWIERAAAGKAQDLGALLDPTLFPLGRDWRKACEQLDQLATFQADPRIAGLLTGWILEPPFDSAASRKAWKRTFDEIVRHDDPRTVHRLAEREDFSSAFGGSHTLRDWIHPTVNGLLAQLAARHPVAPALPTDCDPACRRVEALLEQPGGDREALRLAVLAHPEDDHLRLVYGDLLQQLGDPRGELIALQMQADATRPQRARERELLTLHKRAWLDELEPVLQKSRAVFARGFLSEARLDTAPSDRLVDSPTWATVEVLALRGDRSEAVDRLVLEPHLPMLRVLREVPLALGRRLCSAQRPRPRLETLGCSMKVWGGHDDWIIPTIPDLDGLLAALAGHPGLPDLRRLEICCHGVGPGRIGRLFDATLDELVVTSTEVDGWLTGLQGRATTVGMVILQDEDHHPVATFVRDKTGRLVRAAS